jgi:hypothetical protein
MCGKVILGILLVSAVFATYQAEALQFEHCRFSRPH